MQALSAAVVTDAAVLCAKQGLETPKAQQAASALGFAEARFFMAGEIGFKRVADLQVVLLSA